MYLIVKSITCYCAGRYRVFCCKNSGQKNTLGNANPPGFVTDNLQPSTIICLQGFENRLYVFCLLGDQA